MKHLWFLLDDEYAFLKEKVFVYVECTHPKFARKIPDNFFALIEKLGIPKNQLVKITSTTQFAKIYVPKPCYFTDTVLQNRVYTKEYAALIEKIKNQVQLTSDAKKIYLTRTSFDNYGEKKYKKDRGEKDIENLFRKNGYTIVSPEKYSLDEQIALFKNAEILAGTDGSIMHNCVFKGKNTKLIILRKASYINGHQLVFNQVADANVIYIDIHKSIMAHKKKDCWGPWNGPFFLYASKALCNFLNEKRQPFPLMHFLAYVITESKTLRRLGYFFLFPLLHLIDRIENFLEPLIGEQVRAVKKILKKHRA